MGLLLKIALFGVAVYGVWKTFRYWKGMFDRFTGKPEVPPPPAPTRKVIVEDTVQCAGCGAYISTAAEKCGQCGRPRP
jgi:hypothetical protein